MDEFTCEYDFEDLIIAGYGTAARFDGTAELSADQEPGQFYVKSIQVGPMILSREDGSFSGELFRKISATIYATPDVEMFYAERYAEFNKPSFDHVYDAKREREIL